MVFGLGEFFLRILWLVVFGVWMRGLEIFVIVLREEKENNIVYGKGTFVVVG